MKKYLDALAAVHAVLNEVDPENLITTGAPEDEYDHEASALVRLVLRCEVSRERVGEVWQEQFGLTDHDMRGSRLAVLTERLHELAYRYAGDG